MVNREINKDTERTILQAAEQEFMQKGYDGAKTVAIARRAGVTHAMLHYYFGTKERLFNEIFDEKFRMISQLAANIFFTSGLSLTERVRELVEQHFNFLIANPDLPRFLLNEMISKPERRMVLKEKFTQLQLQMFPRMQQVWDEMIEKERVSSVNFIDFFLDILSLNVFIFISLPLLEDFVIDSVYGSKEQFFEARKRENIRIIMQRLTNNEKYE